MAAPLKDQLRHGDPTALKAGDSLRVGTLRMLSAAVTNREKDVLHDLSDDEVREMATKEVKKRTEAIDAYTDAGRMDLADRERAERRTCALRAGATRQARRSTPSSRRRSRPPEPAGRRTWAR